MPAPTPIQIRYGMDPNALGELALATGTARRQYSEYQTQLSADRSFIQNELNRRTEDTRYRNNFNLSLLGMQSDERMAREQASALQQAASYNQRQAGQTGVTSPATSGSQSITLVPDPEAVEERPQGSGSVTFYERDNPESRSTFYSENGEISPYARNTGSGPPLNLPPSDQAGFVVGGGQEGITPDLRTRLDYIEALRASGGYSEPLLNSMRVAARQGMGLSDIQKLADDGKSSGSGRRTAEETVADQYKRYAARIRIADSLKTPAARDQARLDLMGVREGFEQRRILNSDEGVKPLWDLYKEEVAKGVGIADPTTITRRPPGSSESNPLYLSHPSQVKDLPSGTHFVTSAGVSMIRQ